MKVKMLFKILNIIIFVFILLNFNIMLVTASDYIDNDIKILQI